MIPAPGLGVDRLADRAQQAQGLAAGRLHRGVALAHQGAQGRGGGVEDVDLMLVHHLPEAADGGIVGHALEHQGRRRIGQGAVDDIGVARDPAHVGGAPEHLAGAVIEHQLMGIAGPEQIAAGGVQHALGLSGRAGGVEDEQRVFGVHRLGRAVGRGLVRLDAPVQVAALDERNLGAGVAQDDDGLHAPDLL
ncbi:hypothetical protein D3C80_1602960 [compost metagenome]